MNRSSVKVKHFILQRQRWSEYATSTMPSGVTETLYNTTVQIVNMTSTHDVADIDSLARFSAWYEGIHGYVSILVCTFGIILNVMNIVVLTRRNMVSATNYLLTALATADALTMLSYLPYALYFYCLSSLSRANHPYGWIIYLLFNTNFIITCHTSAMWLTVALAVFRYIVVCHHVLGPRLCNLQRARWTVVAVFTTTVACCTTNYIMYAPAPLPADPATNATVGYWFVQNAFVTSYLKSMNFWLYGVVLKVAPCVLLTVLSSLLLRAMRRAEEKRRRLASQGRSAESERASEHNRTTAMLLAVVLCFVITELPQGTLAFLSGIDNDIFTNIYVPLGDVWDIIVLINSAVNFILYCIMSRQFRQTFNNVFCSRAICIGNATAGKAPNGIHYNTISENCKTKATHL